MEPPLCKAPLPGARQQTQSLWVAPQGPVSPPDLEDLFSSHTCYKDLKATQRGKCSSKSVGNLPDHCFP